MRRALPDLLVALLIAALAGWLVNQERLAAAIQGTRRLAIERRELIARQLDRVQHDLTRLAKELATEPAARPVPDPEEIRGLALAGLDGALRTTFVDPGADAVRPSAAEAAAGRDAWQVTALVELPDKRRALRLVGPVRARAGEPASGVLVALVDSERVLSVMETPIDQRIAPAVTLAQRRGNLLERLDSQAGRAIPGAEVARALGGEPGAALRTDAQGDPIVVAQQRLGAGNWAVIVRASLSEALPESSFPPHVAIPLLVLLGLAAVLLRQPVRAPAGIAADSLGLSVTTSQPPVPALRVEVVPGPEVRMLNRGRLDVLRQAIGDRALTDLVTTFAGNLTKRRAAMRAALEAHDVDQLSSLGHSMYGSAANLGLDRISAIGHWFDAQSRTATPAALSSALLALEREVDGALRELTGYCGDLPTELDRCLSALVDLYVRIDGNLIVRAHSPRAGRDPRLVAWLAEGRPFVDGAIGADQERLAQAVKQAGTGPQQELVAVRVPGTSDSPMRLAWMFCPAPDGRGTLAFGRDASARDAGVAELEAQRDEAVAALRSRSEFLASVTHELRTPMNAVIGMTGLLVATELTPEQRECAQVVRLGAEHLLALVNDILDFSKIEAGKMEIESISFHLRGAVEDVIDLLGLKASQKKVGFVVEMADGLPSAVRGDQSRLRQVLTNLIDNALKFTPEGGRVTVRVNRLQGVADAPAPLYRFEVQDTGEGIPEAAMARLFVPFSQAEASTTRRFGGTGLGLAICKQLVTLMGGGIGAESRPGQGSTFWFALPLCEASDADAAAQDAAREAAADLTPLPFALRALVVDDNPVNQVVASRLLERLNVKADVAGNGREALEMLKLLPYDMVFMDYQMPDIDGPEATRRIRQLEGGGARIPIIGLTANALGQMRETCLAAGMDDFLPKPVSPAMLRATVVRWAPTQPRVSWRDATTGAVEAMRGIFADTPRTGAHFDRSRFRQIQDLVRQHTDSFILNVVEVFLQSSRKNLDELRAAIQSGNRQLACHAAGALRLASEHMGAQVLADHCRALEELTRSGDDLAPLLASIEREVDAISGVLAPRK